MIRRNVKSFEAKAKNVSYSSYLSGDTNRNKLKCKVSVEQSQNYTNDQKGWVDFNSTDRKDANNFPVTLPHTGVGELEETIDYSSKETLISTGSRCMDVKRIQTYSCSSKPNSEAPKSLEKNMTPKSMQLDKHEQTVPYIEKFSDGDIKCFLHHVSLEADTTEVTERYEASIDRTLEQASVTSDGLSLDFLPSSVSDEMGVRKSFVSSSSEKPLSTSLLENSENFNGSNNVHPTLSKLSDDIPDGLRSIGEQSIQEIQYIDLPTPNREYREKVHMLKSFEQAGFQLWGLCPPQHFEDQSCKDKLGVNLNNPCELDKCSSKHLKMPGSSENDDYTFLMPGFNEGAEQVLCQPEENVNLTKVNSPSETHKNMESNMVRSSTPEERVALTEHNCEETFLVSPIADGPYGTSTSTPLPESKNITFFLPALEDFEVSPPKTVRSDIKHVQVSPTALPIQTVKTVSGNSETKLANTKLAVTAVHKSKKAEIISFPKPNFKNVKSKITTRPMVQSKEQMLAKFSPRSSCLSSPSSSIASPKAGFAKVVGKRSVDQDPKLDTIKFPSQLNKLPFSSKVLHAATPSKNASYKVPGIIALKQTPDDGSSSSSICSSAATMSTHARGIKVTEHNVDKTKALVKSNILKPVPVGPRNMQNEHVASPLEKQELIKDIQTASEEVFVSPRPLSSWKNLQKEATPNLRSKIAQPTIKVQAASLVPYLRKGSNKNAISPRVSTPHHGSSQPEASGIDHNSPKGRPTIKTSSAVVTRSLPRRPPLKLSTLQRTPSVSSVYSNQSERSVYSSRSTTAAGSIKNEEIPQKCVHPNGASEIQPSKSVGTKSKVQPLKQPQAGPKTKPLTTNQDLPKSARALPLPRKQSTSGRSNLLSTGTPGLQTPKCSPVEKNKQKTNQRSPCTQTPTFPEEREARELAQSRAKCEKQSGIILQLKQFLASSNQKFDVLAVVVQSLLTQREEALKQHKNLSQELTSLRGDLVISAAACDNLEKERNDLQNAYEGVIQKLKDHHQSELEELEEKLKHFYTEECDKLRNVFIEEAEKYKIQLESKIDKLNTSHDNLKLELETSHSEKLEKMKAAYEESFSEFQKTRELEKRLMDDSLKDKQASLEKIIDELNNENESLKEKLRVEEEQKKLAKEKSIANPQLEYLEQELESLKAVMEIKNEKLHQQDKKLMQIERLVDNNATLVEKLKKYQQENEDLKARMDKHMALSRQLSSEQAVLQESLQKESKVNKRLSMENEELLWKLHNGDLCSPKKLSPTSPLPFQSSRSSGSFSSPTISPR